MPNFALVTEGFTDQIVLKYILAGFFNDPEIALNPLRPLRDATGEMGYGNWLRVLEYCGSIKFKEAVQVNDYLIIQIDTDVSEDKGFGVNHRDENGVENTVEQLIESVKTVFITRMGEEFYRQVADRILFAISLHSIECWLLPLYYPNKDVRRARTAGCFEALNSALSKKEKFTIDKNNKRLEYYDIASRDYSKRKNLMAVYQSNPSLKIFVEQLEKIDQTS